MADNSAERNAERKRHSLLVDSLIRLVKEKPLGTVGAVITLILLLVGIFAKFIAPYGMNASNMRKYIWLRHQFISGWAQIIWDGTC